jgi:hypothetical protein
LPSHNKGRAQTEGVSEQILKRISGPKWDNVTGEWRKLHNKDLHNLYSSLNIIKQGNEMGRPCGTHWRGEKIVQGVGRKARRKETT